MSRLLTPCEVVAQETAAEYRLKAAIVSKFPQFVQWPEAAWSNRPTLEFCILKPNPFGGALHEMITGERVNGRAFTVREVGTPEELDECHVLFATTGPREARARQAAITRAAMLPILTIGDDPDFLSRGGIIGLRMINGRVRFEVDIGSAGRVGLHLSSQLLQLALAVRGGPA